MMLEKFRALFRKITNGHQVTYLVVAFVILAFVVSLMNPLFEPTDEIRHYRFVRLLVTEQRLPVQGQESQRAQGHHPPLFYAISALCSWWAPGGDVSFQYSGNPYWGYRNWEVGVDSKLQYQRSSDSALILQWQLLSAWVIRWVNIAIGAMAIWLTYRLAKLLLPNRDDLALGAAALLAFNPQFIYLSAAINNDVLATLASVAVLYACVDLLQHELSHKRTLTLGVLYGLALLSKLHLAVLGAVIALVVAFVSFRQQTWRERVVVFIRSMMIIGAVTCVLSGWWFVRNYRLYGDLTGMSQLNAMWGGREAGGNWWAIKQSLPYLWSSLWGRFGYGQIALPGVFAWLMLAVVALGTVGWIRVPKSERNLPQDFLCLLTITLFVAIVLYYILIQPAGAMGRFLFPALPALVVLVAKGWGALVRPFKFTGYVLLVMMAVFALIALFGYLAPAVTYPSRQSVDMTGSVQFSDVAQVQVSPLSVDRALPGDTIDITLNWQPLRVTSQPYAIFVHVIDETGVLVAQRDVWPGLGRAPTTVWERPFEDVIRVDLPKTLYTPNAVTVFFGLYDPTSGQRLLTASGTDSVNVGNFIVLASSGDYPNAISANFGDQARLVGYDISPRVLRPGETVTLSVFWQPTGIQADYRMFAQVLDSQWNVWGSRDGDTIDWGTGTIVTVTREITLLPDTPPGTYPIQVGLFSGGTRLPVLAEDGRLMDERVLLGPIKVEE